MYTVQDIPNEYLLKAVNDELKFEHLEAARWLVRKGYVPDVVTPLKWSLEKSHSGKAAEMKAHFCNPAEETAEAKLTRRKRAKVGELRHLWTDPPPPVVEALDTLDKYIEAK
jgi:hypothetical protein